MVRSSFRYRKYELVKSLNNETDYQVIMKKE